MVYVKTLHLKVKKDALPGSFDILPATLGELPAWFGDVLSTLGVVPATFDAPPCQSGGLPATFDMLPCQSGGVYSTSPRVNLSFCLGKKSWKKLVRGIGGVNRPLRQLNCPSTSVILRHEKSYFT